MSKQNFATAKSNLFVRIVSSISTLCGWISAALILSAVFITCQMIFVRFVLNHSTIWQTELVVYLMVSATLIGLPYVQLLRGHVNVDLLPLMMPMQVRKYLAVFTLGLAISMMLIMAFYGAEFWYEAWSRRWKSDTVWGVRLWIPYLAVPVGFFLYGLQLVADLYLVVTNAERPFGLEED